MTEVRDYYQETVARLEPEIAVVDHDAALTSIAISLRRIADVMTGADPAIVDVAHDIARTALQVIKKEWP